MIADTKISWDELTERECAIRAAAYIDTDGSIGISKPNYTLECQFSTTTPPLAEWLKESFGGRIYLDKWNAKNRPDRKQLYFWRLNSKAAELFLVKILPYLVIKQNQALLALELREHQGRRFKNMPIELKREIWKPYYEAMIKLNKESGYHAS